MLNAKVQGLPSPSGPEHRRIYRDFFFGRARPGRTIPAGSKIVVIDNDFSPTEARTTSRDVRRITTRRANTLRTLRFLPKLQQGIRAEGKISLRTKRPAPRAPAPEVVKLPFGICLKVDQDAALDTHDQDSETDAHEHDSVHSGTDLQESVAGSEPEQPPGPGGASGASGERGRHLELQRRFRIGGLCELSYAVSARSVCWICEELGLLPVATRLIPQGSPRWTIKFKSSAPSRFIHDSCIDGLPEDLLQQSVAWLQSQVNRRGGVAEEQLVSEALVRLEPRVAGTSGASGSGIVRG